MTFFHKLFVAFFDNVFLSCEAIPGHFEKKMGTHQYKKKTSPSDLEMRALDPDSFTPPPESPPSRGRRVPPPEVRTRGGGAVHNHPPPGGGLGGVNFGVQIFFGTASGGKPR